MYHTGYAYMTISIKNRRQKYYICHYVYWRDSQADIYCPFLHHINPEEVNTVILSVITKQVEKVYHEYKYVMSKILDTL